MQPFTSSVHNTQNPAHGARLAVRGRRAQIQMGETIAVIFVFLVLVIFGLMWFLQASSSGDPLQRDALQRLELLERTKEVMNLAEFHCSVAGKVDSTCIDLYRVRAFKQLASNAGPSPGPLYEQYAERFYGYSLSINTLYPDSSRVHPGMEIFSFRPQGHEQEAQVVIPVVLYDPIEEKKYFSVLILTQHLPGGVS